ncbi:hypothetical protein [Leucobacter komagatae]|uniref:Uncharacterized protein n=1 Tax=Leucobacter komagatae TaxID=55969 RepID=A0A0D0I1Q5_9MICO|nr:hypothetical protein [Leucobacter komagatae]KIP53666.1 hypothetical protein SD72_00050 [Leucobacter komagatae]
MAKQGEVLFEESSQGAVSAVTAIVFILSFALAMGGIVLATYGFNPELSASTELFVFAGGLALSTIGFILPFTILPKIGK